MRHPLAWSEIHQAHSLYLLPQVIKLQSFELEVFSSLSLSPSWKQREKIGFLRSEGVLSKIVLENITLRLFSTSSSHFSQKGGHRFSSDSKILVSKRVVVMAGRGKCCHQKLPILDFPYFCQISDMCRRFPFVNVAVLQGGKYKSLCACSYRQSYYWLRWWSLVFSKPLNLQLPGEFPSSQRFLTKKAKQIQGDCDILFRAFFPH